MAGQAQQKSAAQSSARAAPRRTAPHGRAAWQLRAPRAPAAVTRRRLAVGSAAQSSRRARPVAAAVASGSTTHAEKHHPPRTKTASHLTPVLRVFVRQLRIELQPAAARTWEGGHARDAARRGAARGGRRRGSSQIR
eukprot:115581-Chlamydomonas_euryale.AAC.2